MADQTKTIDIIVNTEKAVKSVDNLNDSLEDGTEETKAYKKQLEETEKVTGAFTQQLDKMTGGMFSSAKGILTTIKGLKSFKVALIATGLGAFLVIIGAVTTAFSRLEGPMRLITEVTGGLSSVMNVLLDRFGLLGEAMISLFQGDTTKALEKWGEAWEGISENMAEAYNLGVLIAKQTRESSLNESARNAVIAKNRRELERELLLSRDISRSIQDRQTNIERANEIGLKNLALQRKTAEEQLTIAKNTFEDSSKNNADRIAFNEALATFHNQQLNFEKTLRDLENRRVDLYRQQLTAQQKTTTELQKQKTLLGEVEDEAIVLKSTYNEFADQSEEAAKNTEIALDATSAASVQATDDQEGLNDALGVTTQAAKGLLDIFQGKVDGKDIFKSVLNTLGGILNLVLPGASAVTGLIGGLFEDGGMLKGPSHKQGGIWVNAEGGEGIINKRSMSIPWVHSLASELNQIGGGVKFADGGIVAGQTAQEAQISQLSQSLQQQRTVLYREDVKTLDNQIESIEYRSTL